jgi:capsular polysaccharide biosynthesis protein
MLNQIKLNILKSNIAKTFYKIALVIIAIYISFFIFSFILTIFILLAIYFTLKRIFFTKKGENIKKQYSKSAQDMIEINPRK